MNVGFAFAFALALSLARRRLSLLFACFFFPALVGCASPTAPTGLTMPAAMKAWSARGLPGKKLTDYSFADRGGKACVLAQARQSVSLWRRALNVTTDELHTLQFDWWIAGAGLLNTRASVTASSTDDAPARLLLGFEGDDARLTVNNRLQFELAEALTGEAPPFATLMYVWDATAAAETVVVSARSDRIRKIVVGSGVGDGRWQRLQRDVRADYLRAFGEAPGRLISMALMTDADNTASRAEACYGSILLLDAERQPLDGSLQL